MASLRQRREAEVARQKRRNIKDLFQTLVFIACLILWAAVLMGIADFCAGGW
jgi:hypothetical protein